VEEAGGSLRCGSCALQARVLATAAEAIRVITALVYPILPESAAKVWRQLGQGEIADAAKTHF
jgi:methionyl-tRNA synthetase